MSETTKDKAIKHYLPMVLSLVAEELNRLTQGASEAAKAIEEFTKAYEKDGRANAWTEERRAKHSAKVKAKLQEETESAKAKRQAAEVFVWEFKDTPPKRFESLAAAADYMKSTPNSLKVRKSQNAGLGVIWMRSQREMRVLAHNEEDMKRLLRLKYEKTMVQDDILELPTKNMKNY